MRTSIKDTMLFRPAPEYYEIAKRVVESPAFKWHFHHIELDRIIFLYELTCQETNMAACVIDIKQPYSNLLAMLYVEQNMLPPDFIICIFGHHAEMKSDEWKLMVMLHELEHIQADGKLKDHDVEDFAYILRKFGVDWHADTDLPDITKLAVTDITVAVT